MNKCKREITCLKRKFSILKSGLILKVPIPVSAYCTELLGALECKAPINIFTKIRDDKEAEIQITMMVS